MRTRCLMLTVTAISAALPLSTRANGLKFRSFPTNRSHPESPLRGRFNVLAQEWFQTFNSFKSTRSVVPCLPLTAQGSWHGLSSSQIPLNLPLPKGDFQSFQSFTAD